jgi:hypothetical protein
MTAATITLAGPCFFTYFIAYIKLPPVASIVSAIITVLFTTLGIAI